MKAKTIGKLLTKNHHRRHVLNRAENCQVNGQYLFCTQNNGNDTTKSPIGLFKTSTSKTTCLMVDAAIFTYYGFKSLVAA